VGFKQKLMKQLSDPDKLKNLADKAQKAVSDNQEQLNGAIGKAGAVVSKKTGGKYDDKIAKVSDAATDAIDKVTTAGTGDEAGAEAAKPDAKPPAPAPAADSAAQSAADVKPPAADAKQPAAEPE
jgi:hypothetical protein